MYAGILSDSVDLVRVLCVQRLAVQMPLGGRLLSGNEVDRARLFIDAHDGALAEVIDHPLASGQLPNQLSIGCIQI